MPRSRHTIRKGPKSRGSRKRRMAKFRSASTYIVEAEVGVTNMRFVFVNGKYFFQGQRDLEDNTLTNDLIVRLLFDNDTIPFRRLQELHALLLKLLNELGEEPNDDNIYVGKGADDRTFTISYRRPDYTMNPNFFDIIQKAIKITTVTNPNSNGTITGLFTA